MSLGLNVFGVKCLWGQLSLGLNVFEVKSPGVKCTGVKCTGVKCLWGEMSWNRNLSISGIATIQTKIIECVFSNISNTLHFFQYCISQNIHWCVSFISLICNSILIFNLRISGKILDFRRQWFYGLDGKQKMKKSRPMSQSLLYWFID